MHSAAVVGNVFHSTFTNFLKKSMSRLSCCRTLIGHDGAVAALHHGAPGQVTWLEDLPPWLCPACCFASAIIEQK